MASLAEAQREDAMMHSSIGPYRVLEKLGEGGMGEVYRARDAKLNRDVAIKVLPELFAADPDRLARFQREAQVAAGSPTERAKTISMSSSPPLSVIPGEQRW